jgi:dsRNA-specific ribonuclease
VIGSKNGKGSITDLKELVDRNRELVVTHSISERTEEGQTIFRHATTINGKTVSGEGKTKKRAEAVAASKALVEFSQMDPQ